MHCFAKMASTPNKPVTGPAIKPAFQKGDLVRFKSNLDDYTLYNSRDGIVYELMPSPSEVYRGQVVRIAAVNGSRYKAEWIDGSPIPGDLVDGMFEPEVIKRKKERSIDDLRSELHFRQAQEQYRAFHNFAKNFNSHGRSISELEVLVDKALREFKQNDQYEKITNIAKLTRKAKQFVDEGKDPEELFKQISEEAMRSFAPQSKSVDETIKDSLSKVENIGSICFGLAMIALVIIAISGMTELAASLFVGIIAGFITRLIMVNIGK